MLETVDLRAQLPKSDYKTAMERLDLRLAQLQRDLWGAGVPVLVVFEGWDAAGKGLVLGRILQAFDPRGFKVHNVGAPTELARCWPPMGRYWNITPADGQIAIYNHSWYRQVLNERVEDGVSAQALQEANERIRVFERQLTDDDAVIVKFFLHIDKKEQAKRFRRLRKDPAFAWKVGKAEQRRHKLYNRYAEAVEDMLRETSTPYAPWTLVPSTDDRFACVTVAETLAAAFDRALALKKPHVAAKKKVPMRRRRTSPLDRVDMTAVLDDKKYGERVDTLQEELRRLQHLCYRERVPVVMVYEGWDAAGKGGNIRRLLGELDPRGYEVVPVGAPTGDEKTHHYLWRFWRALPKAGHFTVFDRSWYGRVLVERVEGFATRDEWSRAYREINEFEEQLAEYGTVVVKFWIHISKEEQLARFEARQNTPHKRWKITDEDWRNRKRWDDYWIAVSDMIEQTSTLQAPWTIIAGNDKRYARMQALETVAARISDRLKGKK
ncbi:MAG TPA: polyphosphate:AMP phosphotransferase [Candidatus Hydrogenedentes bacterium]|nr:polyphosphate:AMP phosphotransferase [Candidatus Hydrogenedentota bacterium]HQM47676.1 polyphosphate:AMP phosphotransferase [Candidatus Hydrogenedentota bacterium]